METQKRYLSDAEADFQNRLAKDEAYFGKFAWAYVKAKEEIDSFFEWAWTHLKEVEG